MLGVPSSEHVISEAEEGSRESSVKAVSLQGELISLAESAASPTEKTTIPTSEKILPASVENLEDSVVNSESKEKKEKDHSSESQIEALQDIEKNNKISKVEKVSTTNSETKSTLQPTTFAQFSQDVQAIWEQKKECVVKVFGTKHDHSIAYGTGFFIDQSGRILTTATVTSEAANLWVEYGSLSYAAKLLGKDDLTNLAVLELLKAPEHFYSVDLPHCTRRNPCKLGTMVLALGSVFEMEPAPMLGMVTGEHLYYGDHVFVTSYIRSNIEILGGESGAPVFDTTGSLYGILIAALPEIRSSFIIPAEVLHRIVEPLTQGCTVPYGTAGFTVHGELSEDGEKVLVISSLLNSAMADGEGTPVLDINGLAIGDILVSIDGIEMYEEKDIANYLFFKSPGMHLELTISHRNTDRIREKKYIKRKLYPRIAE